MRLINHQFKAKHERGLPRQHIKKLIFCSWRADLIIKVEELEKLEFSILYQRQGIIRKKRDSESWDKESCINILEILESPESH